MDWSQFEYGVYLVNVLGIIYDPQKKQILIGRRKDDPHLKELTWCFPGGRPKYGEDLDAALKREVKAKTGLDVSVKKLIFARAHPERKEFLSLYYACEPIGGIEKPGELFVETKWVEPGDAQNHFTTSVHPKILDYIKSLTN